MKEKNTGEKKFVSVLCVAALLVSMFAGCGNSDTENPKMRKITVLFMEEDVALAVAVAVAGDSVNSNIPPGGLRHFLDFDKVKSYIYHLE